MPLLSIPTSPHCQRQPLFWCFSLSITCVRFNVLLCITVLCCFVLLSNINCINTAPFIHSPVDGHLGCLQVLVIMNKSANILTQVFVDICFLIPYLNMWEQSCWVIKQFYKKLPNFFFQTRCIIHAATDSALEFWLFHMLASVGWYQSF